MENKDNMIRRAMMLSAQPELPDGFTERLMKRVQRRRRIRAMAETAAYAVSGIVSFAAVAAAGAWAMSKYAGTEPHRPEFPTATFFTAPSLPKLPKLPELPTLGHDELQHIEVWGSMAAASVLFLLCDIIIRRRVMRRIRRA